MPLQQIDLSMILLLNSSNACDGPSGATDSPSETTEMQKIFLSYRRSDSEISTARIYDSLVKNFGEGSVFKDVDAIQLGEDFRQTISSSIMKCRVLLVIIGDNWLDCAGPDGTRRIDDPSDTVRNEIHLALEHGLTVIPVFVGRQSMPTAVTLPECLREMVYKNGVPVRADPDFRTDMERLSRRIWSLLSIQDRVFLAGRSRLTRRTLLGGLAVAATGLLIRRIAQSAAAWEIEDQQTGQRVLRDFKLIYKSTDAAQGFISIDGFGGICKPAGNFSVPENVICQGYRFSGTILGRRLVLSRDPDEFQIAIRPAKDTYDLPTPSDFELALSTTIDPNTFALLVRNQSSDFVDLLFYYHDPRNGALLTDSWELETPPFEPGGERLIRGFHRHPGYFSLFASTHGRPAQHLLKTNLYSRDHPTLLLTSTESGIRGEIVSD